MPAAIEDVRISELVDPTPKQRECIEATRKFRFTLYGGAAGGGKSYLLRWWCLIQLLSLYASTGIKGLVVGLFSVDYPTLQDRQISKIEQEFPKWLGETKRTEKEGLCFFIKEEFGGGRIALRNLQDPSSYKSAEFAAIAVEELTENLREVFEDLVLFRLRTPGVERPAFLAATNPTGRGLQWVKALWVDRKFPPELQHLKHEFCYVPALLQDNPHLGAEYEASLRGLPEKKRKALLEGDWTIPEGQYFINFEESERKVRHAVMMQIIQPWWSCLVAGTMVATERGDVPIELVMAGDMVWTRKGLRRVVKSWMSGKDREVLRATFSDGRKITATGNHNVLANGVFTRLDCMSMGDRIDLWNPSTSTATSIPSTEMVTTDQCLRRSIAISGFTTTDPSQRIITSTTRMGTEPITTLPIWSACQRLFTSVLRIKVCRAVSRIGQRCLRVLLSGARPQRARNTFIYSENSLSDHQRSMKCFARGAARSLGLCRLRHFVLQPVISAGGAELELTISPSLARCAAKTSVPTKQTSCTRVEESVDRSGVWLEELKPCGRANVYDLAVEGEHEFYANGVLVHNCWIGQDWGYKHASPVYWHAVGNVSPEQAKLLGRDWDAPRKCVFTYREHIATLADTDTSEEELGQILAAKSGTEKIGTWILSSDAFGKKTSQNTAAELLKSGAPKFPDPQPANMEPGSRVVGWRFVSNLISADTWFISDMCPEALAAIPSLEYDSDKGGEDIRKTDHLYDDCGDCLRYGLVDMLGVKGVPVAIQRAEIASQFVQEGVIVDHTELAMAMAKFNSEHKNRGRRRAKWSAR